jgi:cytochrome c-type biogenesis protein CcmE
MHDVAWGLRERTILAPPGGRTFAAMDPHRKRRVRLVVALTAALALAGALVYTSFSSASDAVDPTHLLASATPGRSYQLTGKVAKGSVSRGSDVLSFLLRDRDGRGGAVRVAYRGTVPDPFREGREVVLSGHYAGGRFVGDRDSLITKCPSKFQTAAPSGPKRPAQ